MKLLNKFSLVLAACIATAGLYVPAVASGLANDPFIRQTTDHRNFEPGGKFHLFGSRGSVADRTGRITVTPIYTQRWGNLETEYGRIQGKIGYKTHFSNHPHTEHGPFTNSSSRSASDSKGNIGINLSTYNLNWRGTEVHPADAYDGEQGGGYPAPTGARDEYSYTIKGTAASMNIRFDDQRSFWERLADRFDPVKNLPADTKQAWDTATTNNPNLNRAGNAANAVNAAAAGAGNIAGAAASVIGAGDALQGLKTLTAVSGMEAVRALPPSSQFEAVKKITDTGNAVDRARNVVRNWARDNPNTAEAAKAAVNIGGVAFGAARGISSVRKTGINPNKTMGAASNNTMRPNTGAQSANAQTALNKKLSSLQKAQRTAENTRVLPDGRIRYYQKERPASTTGNTRGNSLVTEYNPKTGSVRTWMENRDHSGKVTMIHPKTINGQTVRSQHYPPTKQELNSWKK